MKGRRLEFMLLRRARAARGNAVSGPRGLLRLRIVLVGVNDRAGQPLARRGAIEFIRDVAASGDEMNRSASHIALDRLAANRAGDRRAVDLQRQPSMQGIAIQILRQ